MPHFDFSFSQLELDINHNPSLPLQSDTNFSTPHHISPRCVSWGEMGRAEESWGDLGRAAWKRSLELSNHKLIM